MSSFFKPIVHFSPVLDDFPQQEYSIDFDGATEYMANTTNTLMGLDDRITISFWIKPRIGMHTINSVIFDLVTTNNKNRITFAIRGDLGANIGRLLMYKNDAGATNYKAYTWDNLFAGFLDTWVNVTITYGGGLDLLLYRNGVFVPPTAKLVDLVYVRADSLLKTWVGTWTGGGGSWCDCVFHSMGLWNSKLSSDEVGVLYNEGNGRAVNWAENKRDYVSSANLQHWWRTGNKVSPELGEDSGYADTLIDIETDAVNITDEDRVKDSPPDPA